MEPSTLVIAIVYAVVAGAPGTLMPGAMLGPDRDVPAQVRGVLVPERGVVQLQDESLLRTGDNPGELRLRRGRVRVVADAPMSLLVTDLEVRVGSGSEAIVQHRGVDGIVVCSVRGEVIVTGPGSTFGGTTDGDAAQSDIIEGRIANGRCWNEGHDEETAIEMPMIEAIRQSASVPPPPPIELPDVVGDLTEQLEDVEAEWGDALAQGPRREAQSCGCSENGSTGGGLDPTGPTHPDPDPEQGDPGSLRIHIRLPAAR